VDRKGESEMEKIEWRRGVSRRKWKKRELFVKLGNKGT
jgi:hypothetical protein